VPTLCRQHATGATHSETPRRQFVISVKLSGAAPQ
jgi:hypothetical protein